MAEGIDLELLDGVNLLECENNIGDNELQWGQNMCPVQPGTISKRSGAKYLGLLHSDTTDTFIATMSAAMRDPLRYHFITCDTATGQVRFKSKPDLFSTPGAADLSYAIEDTKGITDQVCIVPFNGTTYFFCGDGLANPQGSLVELPSGVPDVQQFVLAGADNANVHPRLATQYRLRMVFADFGPGYESWLAMSDDYLPSVVGDSILASNGRALIIGDRDSDRIVGLKEVMLSGVGSIPDSALLILKRNTAWLLTGELNQTADTVGHELSLMKFNVSAGCASQATIVTTEYGVIWAGPNNVWMFVPGQVPIPIGNKISPRLKATIQSQQYRWHAEYHDGIYRLAILSPDQDTSVGMPCLEQWWLDMRQGPPQHWKEAKWCGPMNYSDTGTYAMASRKSTESSEKRLLACLPSTYSSTRLFSMCQLDTGDRDDIFPAQNTITGISYARTASVATIVTKNNHGLAEGQTVWIQSFNGSSVVALARYTITAVPTDTSFTFDHSFFVDHPVSTEAIAIWPSSNLVVDVPIIQNSVSPVIASNLLTKQFHFGQPKRRKIWERSDIQLKPTLSSKLTVTLEMSGGGNIQPVSSTFLVNGDADPTGAPVMAAGSGILDNHYMGRGSIPLVFQQESRNIDRFMQFRIQDSAGYLVDSSNYLLYLFGSPNADATYSLTGFNQIFEVPLTLGWYDNIFDLVEMILTRVAAVTSSGWSHDYVATPASNALIPSINSDDGWTWIPMAESTGSGYTAVSSGVSVWEWLGFRPINHPTVGVTPLYSRNYADDSPRVTIAPGFEIQNFGIQYSIIRSLAR